MMAKRGYVDTDTAAFIKIFDNKERKFQPGLTAIYQGKPVTVLDDLPLESSKHDWSYKIKMPDGSEKDVKESELSPA